MNTWQEKYQAEWIRGPDENYYPLSPQGYVDLKFTPLSQTTMISRILSDTRGGVSSKEALGFTRSQLQYFDTTDLSPGMPGLFRNAEGHLVANTWRPPAHPAPTEPGPFPSVEKLLRRLTGSDEGYTYFLNYLAHRYQQPEGPCIVGCLFVTKPGAGKNTLAKILEYIWGAENCATPPAGFLASGFNGDLKGKTLIFADEFQVERQAEQFNLNRLLTADALTYNEKYARRQTLKNVATWLMFTNSTHAVRLQENDRRFSVFACREENLQSGWSEWVAKTFFDYSTEGTLIESILPEVRAFWYELATRDVSSFKLVPFKNDARADLQSFSKPMIDEFLDELRLRGLEDMFQSYLPFEADVKSRVYRKEEDASLCVNRQMLWALFKEYCKQCGVQNVKRTGFVREMTVRGFFELDMVFSGRTHRVFVIPPENLPPVEAALA